jgi:hypothetical protein
MPRVPEGASAIYGARPEFWPQGQYETPYTPVLCPVLLCDVAASLARGSRGRDDRRCREGSHACLVALGGARYAEAAATHRDMAKTDLGVEPPKKLCGTQTQNVHRRGLFVVQASASGCWQFHGTTSGGDDASVCMVSGGAKRQRMAVRAARVPRSCDGHDLPKLSRAYDREGPGNRPRPAPQRGVEFAVAT